MKRLLILLFLAVMVSSCVRDVVLDAKEEPRVVVECVLSDAPVQELRLGFTKGASESEARPLTDAVATLTDLTSDTNVGCFERNDEGIWTLDYSAVPKHTYRLEVQVPGYALICAEDTMPEMPEVYGCTWYPELSSSIFPGGIIKTPDKYKDKLWGTFFSIETLPEYLLIYALDYNPETGRHEIAEEICTDLESVDRYNVTGKLYEPYAKDGNDDFQLYPMLAGASIHKRFLRITRTSGLSDKYCQIGGNFSGDYHRASSREPSPTEGYLVFASVSEQYDRYLSESIFYQQLQESTDITTIYLRDNIFTNIDGGVGIFGTRIEQKHIWARLYTPMDKFRAKE